MFLNVFCGVCLGLSALFVGAGIVIASLMHRSEFKHFGLSGERRVLTPFQAFVVCFFVAAVIAFFPILYIAFFAGEAGILRVVKSVLLSVHTVLRSIVLDGDFSDVKNFIAGAEGLNVGLGAVYSVYMCLVMLAAPVVTAGFLLSFFRDASAMLKYSLKPCRELYVMTELNDLSLALARNILHGPEKEEDSEGRKERKKDKRAEKTEETETSEKAEKPEEPKKPERPEKADVPEKPKKRKKKGEDEETIKPFVPGTRGRIVVFTDVFERNEESDAERIFAARQMGAICVKKDVTDLGLKHLSKCKRKIYFIGMNEDENIGQALTLITRNYGKRLDKKDTEMYVFSNSAESEALLNSVKNGNMKVRRINENRNLVLQQMRIHPIYPLALPAEKDGTKKIRLAIIGLGGYGTELLKTVLWCGQMPGYEIEVHVFDIADGERKIRAIAPELVSKSGNDIPKEAHYKLEFHNGFDVKSPKFLKKIAGIGRLSAVYVTLGDDEQNIETAINVRVSLSRAYDGMPPIYAIVYSASKSEVVKKSGGLVNMEGKSYGITFIGALRDRYTPDQIEQPALEKVAKDLHLSWAMKEKDEKKRASRMEKDGEKFDHYEYYRRSSIAQAVYFELRESLGFFRRKEVTPEDKAYNDVLRDYEHRRWNTYLRGEGYILGADKDHIAKTHKDLIPFDGLSDAEKTKDDF